MALTGCRNIADVTIDLCQPSLGGIKRVWIANYEDASGNSVAATVDENTGATENTITGFTNIASGDWHEYKFRKNTGEMNSTLNITDEGGQYVTTELSLIFSRMDTDKRMAMVALARSQAVAIVEDCNGNRWFLGKDNPLLVTAGEGVTGKAKGDANHYSVTITDDSEEYPYLVQKTAANGPTPSSAE